MEKKEKEKLNANDKLDWYLARIAYEIYVMQLSPRDRDRVDLKKFLLKFDEVPASEAETSKELTEEEKQFRAAQQKHYWGMFFAAAAKKQKQQKRRKK